MWIVRHSLDLTCYLGPPHPYAGFLSGHVSEALPFVLKMGAVWVLKFSFAAWASFFCRSSSHIDSLLSSNQSWCFLSQNPTVSVEYSFRELQMMSHSAVSSEVSFTSEPKTHQPKTVLCSRRIINNKMQKYTFKRPCPCSLSPIPKNLPPLSAFEDFYLVVPRWRIVVRNNTYPSLLQ